MAVLKIERYLISNQCSAFLTGVMCEYLLVGVGNNSGKTVLNTLKFAQI